MVRMQRVMRELAEGETPEAISLRPGDYWSEFAEDINRVMDRLRQQDARTQTTLPLTSETSEVATGEPVSDSGTAGETSIAVALGGQATAQSICSDAPV